MVNKKKIINDPVHGFINIQSNIIFDLLEHKYFQRLRRIKQLGLTYLVYPGAIHSRFQHALGAMHLMKIAIDVIRSKEVEITDKEAEAVTIAILLHDIGHGPFSHTLEQSIINDVSHEELSEFFMEDLNVQFNGKLTLAIKIFRNKYKKRFLHQLVSGQLDMDRLDYLKRDSFFSGVSEGVIGSDRIIKMLTVVNDELVVEAKGIYSIEDFLLARRLMYWQVYLHKTSIAAEQMLILILKRAKELCNLGNVLFGTPYLIFFLENKITRNDFENNKSVNVLDLFSELDDYDLFSSIKVWAKNKDYILSKLCSDLLNRKLFKIEMHSNIFSEDMILKIKKKISEAYNISDQESNYFLVENAISNNAYNKNEGNINILYNNGDLKDIGEASDMLDYEILSKNIEKHYICYPKEIRKMLG